MKTSDQNQQDSSSPAPAKPKGKRGGARPNTGGARPGAGRPVGARDQRAQMTQEIVAKYKITPLDYMLAVLNGDHEDARSAADRQWASAAAAPYMHPRLSQVNATTENKHTIDSNEAAQLTKDIIKSMFGG